MRVKVRNRHKLNITFEGGEQLALKPGFYLRIEHYSFQVMTYKGRTCYKCYVHNFHSDVRHKLNESGYFLASRQVLARIFSSKEIEIF